jgi:cytidylate kinase
MSKPAEPAPVIAIDGPSASGKGTVAQAVAKRLGFHYLESGALYRLVALAAQRAGVAAGEADALAGLSRGLRIAFRDGLVYLDDQDVTDDLRSEDCGRRASEVAAIPAVRAALLERQRAFRQMPGLVADGRDMGTLVFADAGLKVFLTATPEVRAQRRHKQLNDKGIHANLRALSRDLEQRDARDAARAVAPLVAAPDAVQLDTSQLDVDEVVERIVRWCVERNLAG